MEGLAGMAHANPVCPLQCCFRSGIPNHVPSSNSLCPCFHLCIPVIISIALRMYAVQAWCTGAMCYKGRGASSALMSPILFSRFPAILVPDPS